MSSFQAYSRSMDELTYQLNLSDTLDWSYDEEDETNSTIANLEGNKSKIYLMIPNSSSWIILIITVDDFKIIQ